MTGKPNASFEPSLHYLVLKKPRWDLSKFEGVSQNIGTAMKRKPIITSEKKDL